MIPGIGKAVSGAAGRGWRRGATLALLAGLTLLGSAGRSEAQYFSGQLFGIGSSPGAIAMGDFNSDGKPDYVTANNSSITVYLGRGDGSFQAGVSYTFNAMPTGVFPAAVAVGDFNGDGKLDIAAVDGSANMVAVFLNYGGGAFNPMPQTLAVGNGPVSLVVGDFNGDGKADIATANSGGSSVSVIIGNGNGTFRPNVDTTLPNAPATLAAADLNADGKLDLVFTQNSPNNAIGVLYGRGNGAFFNPVALATDYSETRVFIADVNGDGSPDPRERRGRLQQLPQCVSQ